MTPDYTITKDKNTIKIYVHGIYWTTKNHITSGKYEGKVLTRVTRSNSKANAQKAAKAHAELNGWKETT